MRGQASGQLRIGSLDGLRGLAALVVVLHHVLLTRPLYSHAVLQGRVKQWRWYLYSPLHVVTAGTEAVVVFFVLSGFVLVLPVISRPSFSYRAYYPSRLVRLYLPVVVAVGLAAFIAYATPFSDAGSFPSLWLSQHAHALSAHGVLKDVTLVGGASALNDPLWSLRWEVYFSLLLPVYVWLVVRYAHRARRLLLLCLLMASVMAPILSGAVYLVQFAAGAVLAVGLSRLNARLTQVNSSRFSSVFWLVSGIVAICCLTANWTVVHYLHGAWLKLDPALVLAGGVLLVVMALGSPGFQALLTTRPALWLGRISFSLYLVHEPLIVAVSTRTPASLQWLAMPLALVLSLLVASVFFSWVEAPAHAISKRVRRRLEPHVVRQDRAPAIRSSSMS